MREAKHTLTVTIDGKHMVTVIGRDAWALEQLMDAGKVGCTPITRPAPRWSQYIHKLRRAGFNIETIHEPHSGPYPGHHARYLLHSQVTIDPESQVA